MRNKLNELGQLLLLLLAGIEHWHFPPRFYKSGCSLGFQHITLFSLETLFLAVFICFLVFFYKALRWGVKICVCEIIHFFYCYTATSLQLQQHSLMMMMIEVLLRIMIKVFFSEAGAAPYIHVSDKGLLMPSWQFRACDPALAPQSF